MASYLILGATGTLGRAMIKELQLYSSTSRIVALSRDELKLSELEKEFPGIETYIGDIRDKESISPAFIGIDVVFHFAALKRIPELEKFPRESLKTNVFGTLNAAECALANRVSHFIFSSTDKACRPINTYGACKFLSEQMIFNFNKAGKTNFSVYRWGNVLGSRGSVLHMFKEKLLQNDVIPITDADMSRFWIKIEDAVKFILSNYQERSSEVRIPPMKAAPVVDLLSAMSSEMKKTFTFSIVGLRPGEKIHEDIRVVEGRVENSNNAAQYQERELRDLVKGVI